jgi:isoleucyl-tRNA synthetase
MGHVSDESGAKMSKSKGNVNMPVDALRKHGAEAVRWYFYVNSAPWLPNRFHDGAVAEYQRRFMGTLWNTYAFFVLYANIDDFAAAEHSLDTASLAVMDKWLLSKLNTLVGEVDGHLDQYRVTEAARALDAFVDEMSNWYVRRSRERFWAKGMEQDKVSAYMSLYTALVTLCKCAAPMVPFITDEIYCNLVLSHDQSAPESIHLCDFPTADASLIDKELEEAMDLALRIVAKGRACRNTANIKNRQPLSEMLVKVSEQLAGYYIDIIKDELNVKAVVFTDDVREYTSYTFKPQLRTVGPKYGKQLGYIQKALAELDGNAAMEELKNTGVIKFAAPGTDGSEIVLAEEDLLIEVSQKEGYVSEADNKVAVVINIQLNDDLIEEGFVFELISKIQTMRKEAGFEVTDRIRVQLAGNQRLAEIAARNHAAIATKVLADALGSEPLTSQASSKEWNVNGETVTIAVERV